MDKQELQKWIYNCHDAGKKVAVSFCSHIPVELLEAAGICHIRIPYIQGVRDYASGILPKNVCPVVKNCCDVCEDDCLRDVDLILAETSCDGKRKMYELISGQERVYFYQVAQGADRDYVKPLIRSECRYLQKELESRFGVSVTEEAIRTAGELLNRERESLCSLMSVQQQAPPAAWGQEIFRAMEECRALPDIAERIKVYEHVREKLISEKSPVPKSARRILVTGCPLSGLYRKILNAVEENGGAVVCFETCEAMKSAVRRFDTEKEDVYEALADCYQNTACAIMSPNTLRFELLEHLARDYRVDGILDIMLQTCHPYTVERDRISRLCKDRIGVPYMAISTDTSESDTGQIATRVTAFLEML